MGQDARVKALRFHVELIARNTSGVPPQVIATKALEDDDGFERCSHGTHTWVALTAFNSEQDVARCQFCGIYRSAGATTQQET